MRNHLAPPVDALLRSGPDQLRDAPRGAGTDPGVLEPSTALLRSLTQRPSADVRSTAKTISRMRPEVVVPAAADPAVLVDVHRDLRLSLGRLCAETDTTLAPSYLVTTLATGVVDLAPHDESASVDTDSDAGDRSECAAFLVLRTDARSRLVLTKSILHRLAVPVGEKVLVTMQPATGTLRLLNLATLADAVEAQIASAHTRAADNTKETP